jgi:hypothetical protein
MQGTIRAVVLPEDRLSRCIARVRTRCARAESYVTTTELYLMIYFTVTVVRMKMSPMGQALPDCESDDVQTCDVLIWDPLQSGDARRVQSLRVSNRTMYNLAGGWKLTALEPGRRYCYFPFRMEISVPPLKLGLEMLGLEIMLTKITLLLSFLFSLLIQKRIIGSWAGVLRK